MGEPRLTAPMRRFLEGVRKAVPPEQQALVDAPSRATTPSAPRPRSAPCATRCSPARPRALLRDSISPDVLHAGIKYNVIPGEAVVEIDCRTLPGTTPDDMREEILARLGDLAQHCTLEHVIGRPPVEAPARATSTSCWPRRSAPTTPTGSRSR